MKNTNTITTAATILLAERDGIHPAHAANRLAIATQVAEVMLDAANGDARPIWSATDSLEGIIAMGNEDSPTGRAVRAIIGHRVRLDLTLSEATWNLATALATATAAQA